MLGEWGRIGCLGFGGPPTHIAMLRELTVERRGWLAADELEDAIAACNMMPGAGVHPVCHLLRVAAAWLGRVASSPPDWARGAGAGAGAAVAAVALQAGLGLVPASYARGRARSRLRWPVYAVAGALTAALAGPWVVLALIACGLVEVAAQRSPVGHCRTKTYSGSRLRR